MSKRLFTGIELPDSIKEQLAALPKNLPDIHWAKAASMHVTMRFLGEQPEPAFECIHAALEYVTAEAFSLTLSGLGYFSGKGGGVLWAGLEPSPDLQNLKMLIDLVLHERCGIKPEQRPYAPHITIGRMRMVHKQSLEAYIEKYGRAIRFRVAVNNFVLFSSVLQPLGALHHPEARYLLV